MLMKIVVAGGFAYNESETLPSPIVLVIIIASDFIQVRNKNLRNNKRAKFAIQKKLST